MIYNEKEKVGQEEIQNVQFEEKRSTRKFHVRAKAYAERDEDIKKMSDPLKGRGALNSRPHQLRFQFVKIKCLRNVLLQKNNNK